jgi:hypothetical protein
VEKIELKITAKPVKGKVKVAAETPGRQAAPAAFLDIVLEALGDPLNCSGPVAVDQVVYAADRSTTWTKPRKFVTRRTIRTMHRISSVALTIRLAQSHVALSASMRRLQAEDLCQ